MRILAHFTHFIPVFGPFDPFFAPVGPQNKVNLVDIEGVAFTYTPNHSCDLLSKYNVYNVNYREMGTFFIQFDPRFDPRTLIKQRKIG